MQKPITLKMIASELGLSVSAVSKALNNYHDIGEETRKMVVDKAISLGYKWSLALSDEEKKESFNTVGLIMDLSIAYGELFRPLSKEAKKRDLNVLIADSHKDVEEENKCIRLMLESRVKGLIIIPVDGNIERINNLIGGRIPVVFLGNTITDTDQYYVSAESKTGTILVMDYLFKKGHRNIALISDAKKLDSTVAKISTYEKYMQDHKLLPAVFACSSYSTNPAEAGYTETVKMLSVNRNFTAIYAINDHIAVGAIKALQDSGLRVPEDISVIGYNDYEISSSPLIELTTVAWPLEEMAGKLIDMVFSQLNGNKNTIPYHCVFAPSVLERKTCREL